MATFDLVTLRLFIAVVEQKSISEGARSNNIAASAVSKRISDAEARAGVAFLFRYKDGVEPTPAGMAVYERGKSILKAMEELEGGISEYTSGVRGLIRLSANPSAITQFLPDDLAAYSQMFPEVQVDIEGRLSSEIVASVTDCSADIGIFSEHQGEHDFQTRVYRRDTLVAISAVGHSLTKRTDIRFSDLLAYNHVGLANGSSLQAKLIQKAREVGLDIRFSVRVHSFDGIRRFVEAGLGVAVLPHGAVRPFLSNTNLVCHDIHEEWATRSLLLGFRDYRSLSVVARKFVDFIAPD